MEIQIARNCLARRFVGVLLAGIGVLLGCDSTSPTRSCTKPEILSSSIDLPPANVLSAVLTARVREADSVAVRFGIAGGPLDSHTPGITNPGDTVLLPLLGLRDRTRYDAQVVAFSDCDTTAGSISSFTTEALPADLSPAT